MAIECQECGGKIGLFGKAAADENVCEGWRARGYVIPKRLCHECSLPHVINASDDYRQKEHAKKEMDISFSKAHLSVDVFTFVPEFSSPYKNMGIATAHVAIGSGASVQFLAGLKSLSGEQSEQYSKKIQEAERACLYKLKKNASEIGANAVVGTHITYTELTAGQGTLLVCMAGTAIIADNPK